jgi:hypothetical protein
VAGEVVRARVFRVLQDRGIAANSSRQPLDRSRCCAPERFMSEVRALTSTMSNAVACVVVAIWETATATCWA